MARHAGNAVVENDDGGNTFVVCYVYKAGDARVNKGGVTDDGHRVLCGFVVVCLVESVK